MTEGVLVYMFKDNQLLLAMKKRGFGEGKWNGPGGKMLPNETPAVAGVRETQEEVSMTPVLIDELGQIRYHDVVHGDWTVHVFRAEQFSGQPTESEEMQPQWFNVDALPYDTMWNGDEQWMPLVIKNQKFSAEMWFDGTGNNIRHEIKLL